MHRRLDTTVVTKENLGKWRNRTSNQSQVKHEFPIPLSPTWKYQSRLAFFFGADWHPVEGSTIPQKHSFECHVKFTALRDIQILPSTNCKAISSPWITGKKNYIEKHSKFTVSHNIINKKKHWDTKTKPSNQNSLLFLDGFLRICFFQKNKNQPAFTVPHPTRGVRYCDQTERSGQQFLCLKQGRRLQNDDSGTNTGILFVFLCVWTQYIQAVLSKETLRIM